MRGPYTKLYLHLVWSTWDRLPLLEEKNEPRLYRAFSVACEERNCSLLAIGGVSDHIHLLVQFPTTISIAKLVADLKGSTSHLINHQLTPGQFFKWQGGYGAFTLHQESLSGVRGYILNQKAHHTTGTLWETWEQTESAE